MARPRCSRNDPKRLRSRGAIVLRASIHTRVAALASGAALGCARANGFVPINMPADTPVAAPAACLRKRRLEREKRLIVNSNRQTIYRRNYFSESNQADSRVRARRGALSVAIVVLWATRFALLCN